MATKHRGGAPAQSARPAAPAVPEAPPANLPIPPQSADEVEAIRARAYQLWEAAGRPDGDGVDYWLQAEREVREGR